MSCNTDQLIAHLESALPPSEDRAVLAHLDACEACRATADEYRRLCDRVLAAARLSPAPALEGGVMSAIASATLRADPSAGWRAWLSGTLFSPRVRRLGLGTAGFVVLVLAVAAVFPWQPSQAWSIEQSIAATRPFHALRLTGTAGGQTRCQVWARSADSASSPARLLIRFENGVVVWTEGNATHYYEPGSRVVHTDDAQTAGFNPWPGPRLFEMARAAGVRRVDAHWRLPWSRTVMTEWSFMGVNGPTSALAEFDLETKLLVSIRQWDNMDLRGVPAFEADDVSYLADLPDSAFAVDLPPGVAYRPRDVEVKEALLGLLSLGESGIPSRGASLEEAARLIVTEMWHAAIARDLAALGRLSPLMRDEGLSAVILSAIGGSDGAVAVVSVDQGVLRGHSRLGPLSVVTSRVRHRDGGLYEEKFIVQHRQFGAEPSCVIAGPYGAPYRLE
jgi:hypothetical protein